MEIKLVWVHKNIKRDSLWSSKDIPLHAFTFYSSPNSILLFANLHGWWSQFLMQLILAEAVFAYYVLACHVFHNVISLPHMNHIFLTWRSTSLTFSFIFTGPQGKFVLKLQMKQRTPTGLTIRHIKHIKTHIMLKPTIWVHKTQVHKSDTINIKRGLYPAITIHLSHVHHQQLTHYSDKNVIALSFLTVYKQRQLVQYSMWSLCVWNEYSKLKIGNIYEEKSQKRNNIFPALFCY